MPKMPNVHIVLNSADGVGQYNDFQVLNPGQNMIQGMIKDVAVSEIQFPYDIPNVMPTYNVFELIIGAPAPAQAVLNIVITPGFYTGTELAAAVNAAIVTAGAAVPVPAGGPLVVADLPQITFSTTTNSFTWEDAVTPGYSQLWLLAAPYSSNYVGGNPNPAVSKTLLSIMGLPLPTANTFPFYQVGDGIPAMGSAPLVFTQFVDITSRKLTRYQHLRDGSSSQEKRRTDLVARVFITNDTSTYSVDPPGTRPFVIHRQFKNQRVFDWTTDGSVDSIDLQLYDDFGSALPTLPSLPPRAYQLTLHAYQNKNEESGENVAYRY